MSRTVIAFVACALLTLEASAAHRLRITSPKKNARLSKPTIIVSGVGADPKGTLEVIVFTDRPYTQKGMPRINRDGSWSFSPVYLTGDYPYTEHTIQVTIIRNGKRRDTASVSGIRRLGPPR